MIQRIRRLDVGQTAKVLGVLYLLLGIVFAVIFGLFGMMVPASMRTEPGMAMFGASFVIFMPIMYGVLGVVFGALVAALYNLVAGWTGGLQLEFEPAGE